jgi:ketosteroid isomerase-like protein
MKPVWFILFLLGLSACNQQAQHGAKAAIAQTMNAQEDAWNSGDLNGFMKAYWHHDSLVFIGSRGLTYGWNTVLNNYKKSYPNQAAMGHLTFHNQLFRDLRNGHYWVAGQWTLHRKTDTLSGHFTLVWKKIDGHWLIISDHSS